MTFHHVNLDISINDIINLCDFKFTEIDKNVRIHSFVRPDIASEFDITFVNSNKYSTITNAKFVITKKN